MSPNEIIDETIKTLRTRGWLQHAGGDRDVGPLCLVAALDLVAETHDRDRYEEVYQIIQAKVQEKYPDMDKFPSLSYWNDYTVKSVEQVIALLEEAKQQ